MKTWLSRLFAKRSATPQSRSASRARLSMEMLETRLVPTVTYHGGALLPHVEAQALYYGSDWSANASDNNQTRQFDGFLRTIVASPYMDMLTQAGYGVGRGTFSPGIIDEAAINKDYYLTDAQVRNALQRDINSGALANPDSNRLYVVFVEPGVAVDARAVPGIGGTSMANDQNGFMGYHSAFSGHDALGHALNIAYAILPYQTGFNGHDPNLGTFDSMTATASHELAEAVTDPGTYGAGWYDASRGGEIGDLVNHQNVRLGDYVVQKVVDQNDQPISPASPASAPAASASVAGGASGPSISVAFSPWIGEVMTVVYADGSLYQFDAFGKHALGSNVQAASVAFTPFGQEVLEVTYRDGSLDQFDAFGKHSLGGNVQAASVAFTPFGQEVLAITYRDGSLWQLDGFGWHHVGNQVRSASIAFDFFGQEVLDVVTANGTLYQFDSTGAHNLGGNVQSAAVAVDRLGERVLDILFSSGALYQLDPYGAHHLADIR